jgi:hypothetical protein
LKRYHQRLSTSQLYAPCNGGNNKNNDDDDDNYDDNKDNDDDAGCNKENAVENVPSAAINKSALYS